MIKNMEMVGLDRSMIASGYPMQITIDGKNIANEHDIKRFVNLAKTKTGSGHDVSLNGVIVQFDLTFTNKAWIEMQRYNFISFVSSQSTMHKISQMNLSSGFIKHTDKRIVEIVTELQNKFLNDKTEENYLSLLYSIPSGLEMTARISTNYRQLKTIYQQRKNHKLPEWRVFCSWIEGLPFMKNILCLND